MEPRVDDTICKSGEPLKNSSARIDQTFQAIGAGLDRCTTSSKASNYVFLQTPTFFLVLFPTLRAMDPLQLQDVVIPSRGT
ncbi:uncharacterized protein LACBIDRAFT_313243 [Laccaria bicolor S238N-H82]|uniref:Predicted protein n=1 Tax=Laccaria bicolor (strain S238N-H82 / ATCC MYA-4686) TaxID=486041 RepID=B0DXV7_LACBS|nr:uncharacterized protein LACBIDRAFT_313243 [Laccaria bicolor S238N-H82]EDR00579.1 predicted protein [Laccaria bicolor S238N-H82]|eukprot:XP_001888806.1 predicted protein [Laccaria bicolor S238N-H82]